MFRSFPEFTKPTIEDRAAYNELIKEYPPLADLSFGRLMTWWNTLDSLAISMLNGNLVISYWLAGDEKHSGLCLVGANKVDESICSILDHLRSRGDQPRLVHVPEFVLSNIRYPEMYHFKEERDYDECIVTLDKLFPIRQNTVKSKADEKAIQALLSKKVEIKSLDPALASTRTLLLEAHLRWVRKGEVNYVLDIVQHSLKAAIAQGKDLGIENVCLFMNGRLEAFLLFQRPYNKEYVIADFFQMNAALPGLYEFLVYKFAEWFLDQGVLYANLDADLGLPILRSMRLKLGPTNFFRKYTVTPV